MFYSQLLLSKKGALGIIWMAAHCHKRLKKDQVQQTNISSSVDKILDDEVPVVTHRILAFLLLGVVRIYSKKVEYLFDDCHEVLNRLCSFKSNTRKSARTDVGVSHTQRRYDSITLPKRFELDTFDLGLVLDVTGGKVRAHEQDTHAGGRRKGSSRRGSFLKGHMDNVLIPETSTACTPPRDVLGAHRMDQDLLVKPSNNLNISLAGVEILRRTYHPLEDCVDPSQLDETEHDQMHYNISNEDWRTNFQGPTNDVDSDSESAMQLNNCPSHGTASPKQMHDNLSGLEMLRGMGFTLEDRLEPMVLDEAEKEQLYDRLSGKSTSSNVQGSIQDVELNSVENQSHERSNPVENMEILYESNFSLEHSPGFKLLNSAEKREGHDKPTIEEHGAKEKHMDHPNTQLNFQEGADQVFTEAVDNVGPNQDVEFNSDQNQSHERSNPVENMEILHESNFSLEHLPSFMLSNAAEKREGCDKPTNEEHGATEKHMDHPSTQLNFQEGADQVFTEAVDNVGPVGPELEVITPESVKCQKPEKFRVSILNHHSKLPADDGTVEVAAVPTPGRKERAKILKKRKALVDVATVVPNKVLKSWIEEDPTDIKRVRKKPPRTLLQVWRAHKLCHAPHSFLEPSIPGVSVDFGYHGCLESYAPEIISAEPSVGQEQVPDIGSHVTEKSPQQMPDVRSPVAESSSGQTADVMSMVLEKPPGEAPVVRSPLAENYSDQIPIAPGTPAAHLNSLRPHEAETIAESGILEPSASPESIEKCSSSNELLGLDALLQEETSSYEGNSLEKDAFSARTRTTANYLGRKFLHKKRRQEEEVLNLSRLLAGKTKKESTIMFYEILVLKTRDCIDVQQETAYRDILVRETPKLRQYFQMSMG